MTVGLTVFVFAGSVNDPLGAYDRVCMPSCDMRAPLSTPLIRWGRASRSHCWRCLLGAASRVSCSSRPLFLVPTDSSDCCGRFESPSPVVVASLEELLVACSGSSSADNVVQVA